MCLGTMVEQIGGIDPAALTDGELADLLVEVTRLREVAEAVQLRAVRACDDRDLHRADGAWSPGMWLRARTNVSRGEALRLNRDARLLRSHPMLDDAMDTIGATKVRIVCRHVSEHLEPAFERDEAMLLEQVGRLTTDETIKAMRHWARIADQDGREPRSWDDSELLLSRTWAGDWDVGGSLDGVSGAELAQALDAEAERIYREGGTDGQRLGLGRRRAMALMEIVRRGLDPERADTRVPPTVMVSVTLTELLKVTGQADLIGHDTLVSAETARRLACDAGVVRLITDGESEILDLGRAVRATPAKFRRALSVRDRGCVFPGCDRPPGHCQPHHIVHWSRGGVTALINLALLCHHHHHLVHEGGWSLSRAPDGALVFRRPDGTRFTL